MLLSIHLDFEKVLVRGGAIKKHIFLLISKGRGVLKKQQTTNNKHFNLAILQTLGGFLILEKYLNYKSLPNPFKVFDHARNGDCPRDRDGDHPRMLTALEMISVKEW